MLSKLIPSLKKNELIRNSFTLFSGSALSQLIPLLIMPVLTRIYSIDAFGIYFLFTAIIVIVSIVSTLQFELTIVLPKDDRDAINLLALSIATTFFVSLVNYLLIAAMKDQIILILNNEGIAGWLYLIPVSVFLNGIFQSFTYFNNRTKDYLNISYGRILKTGSASAVQLIAGGIGYINIGLISGLISGQFFSSVYLTVKVIAKHRTQFHAVSIGRMLSLAKFYRDVPLFNTLISLLNKLSNNLPIFILTRYFGLEAVSFFGLAHRIISAPMGMINQAIGQVFFQEASDRYNRKEVLYPFVKKMYFRLFKIALAPFMLLMLLAPFIFTFIFGSAWAVSGTITQILIPWLFVAFLNAPISYIVTILNKQRVMSIYEIIMLVFRVLALYAGYVFYNDYLYSIFFYSVVGLLFNLIYLGVILKMSAQSAPGYSN